MLTENNPGQPNAEAFAELSDQTILDQDMDALQDDRHKNPSNVQYDKEPTISIIMQVEQHNLPVKETAALEPASPLISGNLPKPEYLEALERLKYLEQNDVYDDAVSLSTVSDSNSDRGYDFGNQQNFGYPSNAMCTPHKAYKYESTSVPPNGLSRSIRYNVSREYPHSANQRRSTRMYSEKQVYSPNKYAERKTSSGRIRKFDPLNPELFLYGKRRKGRPRIYPVKETTSKKYKPVKLFAAMGRPKKNPTANDLLRINMENVAKEPAAVGPERPAKRLRSETAVVDEYATRSTPNSVKAVQNTPISIPFQLPLVSAPVQSPKVPKSIPKTKRIPLAAPENTPDYAHPLLASLRVRRRLGVKKALKSDGDDTKTKNLASEHFIELSKDPNDPSNLVEQINDFFQSPCPVVFSGPQDTGERMLGALLEFNLRNLVGANNFGLFENVISFREVRNTAIEEGMEKLNADDPLNSELEYLHLNISHFETSTPYQSIILQPWGTKSEHYSNQWDGQLKALYNKKKFLKSGLYAEEAEDKVHPKFYTDENFHFPLPINEGEALLSNIAHFDIPHDIKLFVDLNGGVKEVKRSYSTNIPTSFQTIPKNIYVDRKPRKVEVPAICHCELPDDGSPACGASCLNRCMYIECTSDCPNGNRCSNKRFEQKQTVKKISVIKCPGRGFGLQTQEFIPKNKFIMEYRGEIISDATTRERMRTIYANASNHYFLNYGFGEVIDGYRKGTIARFANHSCDPNCHIEKWSYDGECRIGLFALKDIQPGSELTYDYKFESFGPLQKCFCQSESCRGFIGLNKKDLDEDKTKKQGKPGRRKIDYQAIIKPQAVPNAAEDDDSPSNEMIVRRKTKKLPYGSVNIAYKYAYPHRPRRLFLLRNFKTLFKTNYLSISRKIRKARRNTLETIIENLNDEAELDPTETATLTRNGSMINYLVNSQSWPHKLLTYYAKPIPNRPMLLRNIKATNRSQLPAGQAVLAQRKSLTEIIDHLRQNVERVP
ncbi:Histone-Lysine N-Methyltransferase ash1l [Terramyces sp. JEL0728]|nr:Histone-Lysine N-Methyltransferase ash1l [Terramyces sp. JEL0728]